MSKSVSKAKSIQSSSSWSLPRRAGFSSKEGQNRAHFIGIGGIGISSLARWFLAQNWIITGSDAVKNAITQDLVKDGIKVKIGHKTTNLPKNTDLVVYSAAIPAENPELKAAKALGVKQLKYPEALGVLTKQYKTIAIAGSHGKSSTTAMVSSILIKAGMDPTVIIGTKLNGWNFRAGKSEWLVIEADEYKGAFWNYKPYAAIVTNIDLEHIDFYKNLSAVKNSFVKFLNSVSPDGCMVLNGDNPNSVSIIPRIKRGNIIVFSAGDKKIIEKIKKIIKVPGRHNVENALAAWQLTKALGIKENIIEKSISEYKGIWRRIEYKGLTPKGIKVYDDYAHHPTEIRATLQALREKFPKSKIVCVLQPHQNKRLVSLYRDFINSFADADYVLLPDVYNPKGRDEVSQNINSKSLAKDINKLFTDKARWIQDLKNIKKEISKLPLIKGDIIVMMGAGDIVDTTPLLLK